MTAAAITTKRLRGNTGPPPSADHTPIATDRLSKPVRSPGSPGPDQPIGGSGLSLGDGDDDPPGDVPGLAGCLSVGRVLEGKGLLDG